MIAITLYIAAIVAANLSVATFGPISTPINAFFLIGLDLSLRDYLHERWRNRNVALRMLTLFAVAGAISFVLNPATGIIALASVTAFVISGMVDALAYQRLIAKRYLVRSNGSNAAGAIADSILFPTIAFNTLMPGIVLLQFAAKIAGGAAWAYCIDRLRTRAR